MKTNLIKLIITIAAAVTVTLTIASRGAFAQGSVSGVVDNGTVRDGALVWLKNANCFGTQTWQRAMDIAVSLKSGQCGLTDGSTAGQWRLPTIDELISRRMKSSQGFNNAEYYNAYWSSSSYARDTTLAWFVQSQHAINVKTKGYFVWPVRSAP